MKTTRKLLRQMLAESEEELGRYKAKVKSLTRECEILHKQLKEQDAGITEINKMMNGILGALAFVCGKQEEDGAYTLQIPIEEIINGMLQTVSASRDNVKGIYIVRMERKKGEEDDYQQEEDEPNH